jgi:hypothetical protein
MGVFLGVPVRSDLWRRWGEFAFLLGLVLYFRLSGSLPEVPLCPSHYFGYRCLTCGTTRSLWNLLHGDLGTAWRFNPIGFVVLVVLVRRIFVLALPGLSRALEGRWVDWGLLGAFLAFGVLREIAVL